MSKKNNNKRAKEAIKNKASSAEILSAIGLDLSDELVSVGVIFDNLDKSNINICLINSINSIFENFVGVSISVFTHNITEPCTFLLSPIFELKFLFGWTNPLITMSISTTKSALNSNSRFVYNIIARDIDQEYVKENSEVLYNDRVVNILIKPEQEAFFENRRTIKMYDKFDFVKIIKCIVGDLKSGKTD